MAFDWMSLLGGKNLAGFGEKMKEKLSGLRIQGKDSTALVSVELDGYLQVLAVQIDPSLAGDVPRLEKAVAEAIQDALKRHLDGMRQRMGS